MIATDSLRTMSPASLGAYSEVTDGTRVLVVRARHEGASFVRVHIGNMRLPQGARLFVYGVDLGTAVDIAGPYETSGPSAHGSFWTPAVRGSEAVIELQLDGDVPGDLPFDILEIEAADAPVTTEQTATQTEVRTSLYRGVPLTHSVSAGLGVFEGDIILGEERDLRPADRKLHGRSAVAITATSFRWPNGIIPYIIDPAIPNVVRVQNAIAHWNTKLAGVVQMVPRTSEKNYVKFVRSTSASQCASYVGMSGYEQPLFTGDSCATGNLIHEIGHAFGLWHEQSREDRDKFVKIRWENVQTGTEYNFSQNIKDGDDIDGYDFGSIMHYAANSFSKNGLPTIETIPAGISIGQRTSLSAGDIAAITRLYPPPVSNAVPTAPTGTTTTPTTTTETTTTPTTTTPTTTTETTTTPTTTTPAPASSTVAVTVATNPVNMVMRVDGVRYTETQTFNWTVGSVHTVEAVDTAPANATRYTFVSWSDAGARSHSVTASATTTAYTATFALYYMVTTRSYPSLVEGSTSMSMTSADNYYPAGSTITLSAVANPGYCFSNWSELVANTPPTTTLTVTKPYLLVAGFKTGSITLLPAMASAPSAGGNLNLTVTATSGCLWEARTDAPWISIVSGKSAKGSLTVTYSVAPNTTGAQRSATINVNGNIHVVNQM